MKDLDQQHGTARHKGWLSQQPPSASSLACSWGVFRMAKELLMGLVDMSWLYIFFNEKTGGCGAAQPPGLLWLP
jgi:hypothetical protein